MFLRYGRTQTGPEVLWRCAHAQELHAGLDSGQKGPPLGEGVRMGFSTVSIEEYLGARPLAL